MSNVRNIFSILIIFSVVTVFFGLIYEFTSERRTTQDVILALLVLIAPIPITIFISFIMARPSRDTKEREDSENMVNALFFLLFGVVFIFVIMELFRKVLSEGSAKITFPLFINSSVISLYVVNYYHIRSATLAGFVTGTSFGIVFYVIFLL